MASRGHAQKLQGQTPRPHKIAVAYPSTRSVQPLIITQARSGNARPPLSQTRLPIITRASTNRAQHMRAGSQTAMRMPSHQCKQAPKTHSRCHAGISFGSTTQQGKHTAASSSPRAGRGKTLLCRQAHARRRRQRKTAALCSHAAQRSRTRTHTNRQDQQPREPVTLILTRQGRRLAPRHASSTRTAAAAAACGAARQPAPSPSLTPALPPLSTVALARTHRGGKAHERRCCCCACQQCRMCAHTACWRLLAPAGACWRIARARHAVPAQRRDESKWRWIVVKYE